MEASLEELVGKLNTALAYKDYDGAQRIALIMAGRFSPLGDLGYAAKRLFERMGEWSEIKDGSVDTLKLLEVLREEGVMG